MKILVQGWDGQGRGLDFDKRQMPEMGGMLKFQSDR